MTINPQQSREELTRGVQILRGDPRVAIRKLSGPMIIAMLLMAMYQMADAIWVAGIGPDAMAAIGFVNPIYMIMVGLANGLGAGATSTVSRRIGAHDHGAANNAALHALILGTVIAAILTVPLIIFIDKIALILGAGPVADLSADYGRVIFGALIFFFFVQISYAILRAEGDTKRTMYAMGASAMMNIILDPIFIYMAGLGVVGAAIATVISIASVSAVICHWFWVKKDTYVKLRLKEFSFHPQIMRDILGVSLPASLEFFLMSIVAIIINGLLVTIAGTGAVAVYATGWRVVMFAIVPMVGIATSLVAVTGAAYGAGQYEKIRIAHRYAIQLGVAIGVVVSIITWFFAPQITGLFTYSAESSALEPDFILFFHTMIFFYPFTPMSMFSCSVFQGVGRGTTSLIINLFRNLIFIALFAWLFATVLDMKVLGVYLGIVAGNILAAVVGVVWAHLFISRLLRTAETAGQGSL
ncbi:MAG: MATE family efflux transporter [Methanoculleaceae archaeon]